MIEAGPAKDIDYADLMLSALLAVIYAVIIIYSYLK